MKTVNAAVKNAIRNNYQVEARPRLTAEWNMNRYVGTTVTNTPSEDTNGYDIESFPIESIVEPFRPTKGILKGRLDEALVTDLERSGASRYYLVSDQDVYRYWTSPAPTNGSGNFTTTVRPQVIYSKSVDVNKLVIKIENFWATPNAFFIRTTTSATPSYPNDWVVVSTAPTINNKGEITLYWNGTSWSSTAPASMITPPLKAIRGVMVDVTSMKAGIDGNGATTTYHRRRRVGTQWIEEDVNTTGTNSFFNLIEISARRQADLSDVLISVQDELDLSTESDLYPIGTITSNGGSVSLSNLYTESGSQKTGYFNKDNATSPYKDILEPNVKFNLEYIYTIDGVEYPVQQFELYGEEWNGQKSHEININLIDPSKLLEGLIPAPALYEGMTVPEIFQRILDSVGFVDWVLTEQDRNETHIIPIFWTDGEQNVWEILNDLANGTQTAIYFDSYGKMQVKTRWAAFDNLANPVWTFRGEDSGTELADIIELGEDGEVGANSLTVNYQTTKWDKWNNGTPFMQKVWEPESTVTLRSSPLVRNMSISDDRFWISPEDVRVWPYSGIVQIEGELIKYEGKQFIYYTGANGSERHVVIAKNEDEKRRYASKTPSQYKGRNGFTGAIIISSDDDARGHWNSDARAHNVDLGSYSVKRLNSGTVTNNTAGLTHLRQQSLLSITSNSTASGNDATIVTNGATSSTAYKFYGTKFKFSNEIGLGEQRAGLVINSQGSGNADGYFFDLVYTKDNKTRASRHEFTAFSSVNGKITQLDFGVPVAVAINTFYQIDVIFEIINGTHRMNVMFNGRVVMVINIPPSDARFNPANGQFGMFVRGKTRANFEYLYGVARNEKTPEDDSTFFDLVRGGYTGDYFIREFVWGFKTRKKRKKKKWTKEKFRWNQYYFDEFGPYVHEVREFDVKFDPKPVLNSRLYMTNDWGIICTEYHSSPFGAKFVLTNVSRRNEIANGSDSSFGGGRELNQVLTPIGRVLIISDEEKIERKNNDSIRIRGKVEAELSSPWIQTKAMARDIADWMAEHWSEGTDILTLKVFGNPLIELADVVSVVYAEKNMTATTHKYYVTGTSTSFETGIETEVTLRRVRI